MTPPTKENSSSNVQIKTKNSTMLIISNPKTIYDVVAKIAIKTLPVISGEKEYEPLKEMIQVLYANAATLPKKWMTENIVISA